MILSRSTQIRTLWHKSLVSKQIFSSASASLKSFRSPIAITFPKCFSTEASSAPLNPSAPSNPSNQPTNSEPPKKMSSKDWNILTKSRLSASVAATAALGYFLPGLDAQAAQALGLFFGTFLMSCGSGVWNQVIEKDFDAKALRTRLRPVARGAISPLKGYLVSGALFTGGAATLWALTNPLVVFIGAATFFSYGFVYTRLKRYHRYNTEVGAVVGSLPPLMGIFARVQSDPNLSLKFWEYMNINAYTSVMDLLGYDALIAFGILFSWQMSHFMALAIRHYKDYKRAGFLMQTTSIHEQDYENGNFKANTSAAWKGLIWTIIFHLLCLTPFLRYPTLFSSEVLLDHWGLLITLVIQLVYALFQLRAFGRLLMLLRQRSPIYTKPLDSALKSTYASVLVGMGFVCVAHAAAHNETHKNIQGSCPYEKHRHFHLAPLCPYHWKSTKEISAEESTTKTEQPKNSLSPSS